MSKPMEMLRVEKEEEVFDRDVVFGRDITSVFPVESRKVDKDTLEGMGLGAQFASRFVSETELNEIKGKRSTKEAVDDNGEPLRPLAEVLKERKEAKQREFEQGLKTIKQGKNRPLDDEELDFLDSIAEQEREKERAARAAELEELRAFQDMQTERAAQGAAAEAPPPKDKLASLKAPPPPGVAKPKAVARPSLVVVKPATAAGGAAAGTKPAAQGGKAGNEASEPAAKKQKVEEKPAVVGLGLGDYGSGSEADED